MELFNRRQKEYQREYRATLARALFEYKTLSKLVEVESVLQNHSSSSFTLDLIRKYREEQSDALQSLASMVAPLRDEGGATLAAQFSDYIGPTLSVNYDAVVALIIAGMSPASSRATMHSVRRFLAFAKKTGPVPHCLRAVSLGSGTSGAPSCVETYKLVVIHFDSFCSQFCEKQYCTPGPRTCSSATPEASFLNKDAWCQNPCTQVIAHYQQGPAASAERLLPNIPEAPKILNITVGDQELDPSNQRVDVQVGAVGAGVVSLRVRIIHHEFDKASNTWTTYHRLFDTHTPDEYIIIGQLIAGRYYTFQVSAVNEVGYGPFSEAYPHEASGLLVGRRVVTITPLYPVHHQTATSSLDSCSAEPVNADLTNRAPNWMPWEVQLTISELPRNQELAASVEFADVNGSSFTCLNFKLDSADARKASCRIPCQESTLSSSLAVTVWDSNHITKVAQGTLKFEAESESACAAFNPNMPLFCNVDDARNRRCMPAASANASACDACSDAATPKTYRVSSRLCTGFQCQANERWCPIATKGCLTSCDDCYSESSEQQVSGGFICTLPCEVNVDLPNLVQSGTLVVVPSGGTVQFSCAAGLVPAAGADAGSSEANGFHCPADNTQLAYKISELPSRFVCEAAFFQDFIASYHGRPSVVLVS